MLNGKEWEAFFHNGENKEDLISLACSYYKSEEGRKVRVLKKVIKDPSSTLIISKLGTTVLMYDGKIHKSYISTRVRLYKNLKTKS